MEAAIATAVKVGTLVWPFLLRAWEFVEKLAKANSEEERAELIAQRDAALAAHDERWAPADKAIAERDEKMKRDIEAGG